MNDYAEGIEIIIPPKRSVFVQFFLMNWLLAWGYGEFVILNKFINQTDSTPDAFIVFWFCAWTFGGLVAILIWQWNMKGREVIRISDDLLLRRREFVWFLRSRRYQLRHIRNMRLTEVNLANPEMTRGMEFWGLSGGAITFDYGESIEKICLGIDEAEAGRVIEFIKTRFFFV